GRLNPLRPVASAPGHLVEFGVGQLLGVLGGSGLGVGLRGPRLLRHGAAPFSVRTADPGAVPSSSTVQPARNAGIPARSDRGSDRSAALVITSAAGWRLAHCMRAGRLVYVRSN